MANGILGAIIGQAGRGSFEQGLATGRSIRDDRRNEQARGLAGSILSEQFGGDLGQLAQVSPDAARGVFDVLGVVGEARQNQFAQDVRTASALAKTNPEQVVGFVQQAIQRNTARGIQSPEMQAFVQEFQTDPQGATQGLIQLNEVIALSSPQERELRVKERGVELRAQEIEQRALDRQSANQARQDANQIRREEAQIRKQVAQLAGETNQLKREELQRDIASKRRNVQFEASNAIDTVQNSIDTIDRLTTGEGLESAAGISSAFPTLPGTQAANFEAELEALKSQAFLTQVEKMKGLGALSENEGKKLAAAIGALDLSQSDTALRASLGRIKNTLSNAKQKLGRKFNVEAGSRQQAPQGSQQIGRFTVEVE